MAKPLDIVYVNPGRAHYKEDCCWKAKDDSEAERLARWINDYLQIGGAKVINEDTFDAMPEKIGYTD